MKTKTTMKAITSNYPRVFSAGYAELQRIFSHTEPAYYNTGVYGWNCDVYTDDGRGVAISTGYRNTRGPMIPDALVKKYDAAAHEIMKSRATWDATREALEENAEKFMDELLNL